MALELETLVYTDGACSGNPGPGGWGAIVLRRDGRVRELGGGENPTTNNRMEVKAALRALLELEEEAGPVKIYTDSTYLIRGITQWIHGWRRKGWTTSEGAAVQNRDLWEELSATIQRRGKESPVQWIYVRGHRGVPGNERCDEIAVGYSRKERPHLYQGTMMGYDVEIFPPPEDEGLPEMKPTVEKKVAHSYLSLLDGKPLRHRDWKSCEARVKGRPGARFKKAMTADEEREILGGWGVDFTRLKDE